MGYGNYSYEAHQAITTQRSALPTEQVFSQRSCHPLMNPKGVKLRESRDSADHPNSMSIVFALDVNAANVDAQYQSGKAVVGDQQIASATENEERQFALARPGQRFADLFDSRGAKKESRRTTDPDGGQRRDGNVLFDPKGHQTPGIAFFNGRRSRSSTTAMPSAIDARRMKKFA